MSGHAVLAPSKAPQWMPCTGSIALCAKLGAERDRGSVYADEGTAAHAVGAALLLNDAAALAVAETHMRTFYTSDADYRIAREYVDVYVNTVRNAAEGKILWVEQKLSVAKWTTEVGAKGTTDAAVIDLEAAHLRIGDLKFGLGKIVYAENNAQLRLYALSVLELVEMAYGPMETITLTIYQPRRDHVSEETITRDDLLAFGAQAQEKGAIALSLLKAVQEKRPVAIESHLHPTEEGCFFCPAKGQCPAREKQMRDTVFEEFGTVEDGNVKAITRSIEGDEIPSESTLDLIADWVKAKREWIDARLRAGLVTPGWKLVLGKKGNRKWSDEAKVEELLKSLKLKKKDTHEEKLLPLTKLEKLISKPKWVVFETLITQSDAQPISVSSGDKRPEWSAAPTAEGFQNEENYDAFA